MSDKRSLLNGNTSMFSQNPTPQAPAAPAPTPAAQEPAHKAPKRAPRQQVKFYADQEAYEAFKRAHWRLKSQDESLTTMSDHLNRLMIQETERITGEDDKGESRGS